jgi:hypothetical protein
MASRLIARCRQCDHTTDRAQFYRSVPGGVPSFTDVCPVCQSNNVDVVDPEAAAIAARSGYGHADNRAAA